MEENKTNHNTSKEEINRDVLNDKKTFFQLFKSIETKGGERERESYGNRIIWSYISVIMVKATRQEDGPQTDKERWKIEEKISNINLPSEMRKVEA